MMTPEEFAAAMREIARTTRGDIEIAHALADKLLCDLLRALGYEQGIEVYEELPKWYA